MDKTTRQIASLCRKIQKIWDRKNILSISINHNYISFFSLVDKGEVRDYIISHTEFKGAKNNDNNN